jgi:hypothetical protein
MVNHSLSQLLHEQHEVATLRMTFCTKERAGKLVVISHRVCIYRTLYKYIAICPI